MAKLTFLPINLERDLDLAWEFYNDPIAPDVNPAMNPYKTIEQYRDEYLALKLAWDPFGVTHVWEGSTIVGEIVCDVSKFKPTAGYINFYYLIPSHRNRGLGRQLEEFTATLFRQHGFTSVQLSTSPGNPAARAFYRKMGYTELGPRTDKPYLILLEKPLS